MTTTGLRIVTFNVLPPAYQLVVQWAGQFQHTILLVVTTPGPSTRRTPSYRGVLDSAPIGQDVLVTTRLRRAAAAVCCGPQPHPGVSVPLSPPLPPGVHTRPPRRA